jgi:hypothetical protein
MMIVLLTVLATGFLVLVFVGFFDIDVLLESKRPPMGGLVDGA